MENIIIPRVATILNNCQEIDLNQACSVLLNEERALYFLIGLAIGLLISFLIKLTIDRISKEFK